MIRVRALNDISTDGGLAVFILEDRMDGRVGHWLPFTANLEDQGAMFGAPTVSPLIGRAFLQAVLDEAWKHGLRPQDHAGLNKEIVRLEAHLHDMRSLVFRKEVKPRS